MAVSNGTGLAKLMDILFGVLTGIVFASDEKSLYTNLSGPQNVCHFIMVIRPDLYMSQSEYENGFADNTLQSISSGRRI